MTPLGKEVVATESGAVAMEMLKFALAVCLAGELESVAVTVMLKVPVAVGVPEITPVPELMFSPGGSEEPVCAIQDQAMGAIPPLLDSTVVLYAVPRVPLGREAVVMASFGVMVSVNATVAVCGVTAESVAVMEKLYGFAVVGVPERSPAAESVRPPGSVPFVTAQVTTPVPPLEASVTLYGVVTEPVGSAAGVVIASF